MNEDINILFVDDEPNILKSLKRALIDEDFNCFFAESGFEALEIMKENNIGIIVSDMKMPQMDGIELLKIVKEKYPETVKIVLSGFAQLSQVIATINQVDIFKFILKPWKMESDFRVVLDQAIGQYKLLSGRRKMSEELEKKNSLYFKLLDVYKTKNNYTKMDLKNIQCLNSYLFSIIKDNLATNDDSISKKLLNDISFLEQTFYKYLNSLPSEIVNYTVSTIIGKLKMEFKSNQLEVFYREAQNITYNGNYNLIINILISAIKSIFSNTNGMVAISFTEAPKVLTTEIIFSINKDEPSTKENDYSQPSNYMKNFNTLILLLNEFCKTLNTKIEAKQEANKVILSLNIPNIN